MTETESHKEIKNTIASCLKKKGYKTEVEYRQGSYRYDVVVWDKNNKIHYVEVYTYPPRFNMQPPNIKCHACSYEWYTGSKMTRVTCPSCLNKVIKKK